MCINEMKSINKCKTMQIIIKYRNLSEIGLDNKSKSESIH